MKTSRLLIIDNLIIHPLIVALNIVVILLGKILRIDHKLKGKQFKKIAVCKYKGLGSIIQATPLLSSLKKQYPDAEITFVSSISNKDFLKRIDSFNKTILLRDNSLFNIIISFPAFVFRLFKNRFDVYIDLEVYSNFSTLITIFSAAKNRLGFYLQSKKYRMGNYTHMMFYNTQSPISQTYLQFARLLNCNNIDTEISRLHSDTTETQINGKSIKLSELNYFVINPNASDLRYERRWGQEKYVELINNLLKKNPKTHILLIGSKSEKKYVANIADKIHSDMLINLSGKTNIDELIEIIDNANLMITNDSGPMHIAFSCKTQTIALFGPCSPQQYGYHPETLAIYSSVYCSPCVHDFVKPPCMGNNICMKSISVKTVLNAVENYNNEIIANLNLAKFPPIVYNDSNNVYGELSRQ